MFAYLDPSTGSLLMQAAVGGAAGLFVVVRMVFERLPVLTARLFRDRDSASH
jgi:hypothetical protein